MEFKDITTWTISADHKARPKNMFEKPMFTGSAYEGVSNWAVFEQFATQHIYPCSPTLVAGDYQAEMFEKVKFQYKTSNENEWTTDYEAQRDGYSYDDFRKALNYITKFETRQYLQLKQPVKESIPKEITERKTNLGLSNNIEPCPFCGGTEGEQVFLGRTEPDHYQITCICCSVKIKHDRKDKVIGIWNNRKPLEDHN